MRLGKYSAPRAHKLRTNIKAVIYLLIFATWFNVMIRGRIARKAVKMRINII